MMNTHLIRSGILTAALTVLSGCGEIPFKASTNTPCPCGACPARATQDPPSQASFELRAKRTITARDKEHDCNPKKYRGALVMLALSGGGSRAALLSGLSMVEMQNTKLANGSDLLSEVDLISSVSGGSLAAAYYASSGDPDDPNKDKVCLHSYSGRVWDRATVAELMSNDYRNRWIGNWFWPDNILLYWFTTYDRTDMMAQTLADDLFDTSIAGRDLLFRNLNPARPNLVLNATQGSSNTGTVSSFGLPFTFTQDDFRQIGSSIDDYELARGVMASATFPGVFNFMTLRNFRATNTTKKEYVHVFDGGNSDNLGLTSIKREIWQLYESGKLSDYQKIVVILVDAFTDASGVSPLRNDPRRWYDYIVDTDFIIATDSLLAKNRDNLVTEFDTGDIFPYGSEEIMEYANAPIERQRKRQEVALECKKFFSWKDPAEADKTCTTTKWGMLNRGIKDMLVFQHIQFQDVEDPYLKNQLNNIATDFKLGDDKEPNTELDDKGAIVCAVPTLVGTGEEKVRCGSKEYGMKKEVRDKWLRVRQAIEETEFSDARR